MNMMNSAFKPFIFLLLITVAACSWAAPAIDVLGKDFSFPNKINGMPATLSEFSGLKINHFTTSDKVKLAYWEAGKGKPLIIVPGWSSNGAELIDVIYLLSQHYRVFVLDVRNQGLSQQVDYGVRIARYAVDVRELANHLKVEKASYMGWSMGAAVLWSYVDLFGTESMNKVVFIDEPVSIYAHDNWSEKERLDAGGMTSSPERMIAAFTEGAAASNLIIDTKLFERAMDNSSLYYQNSQAFSREFIKNNPQQLAKVLFDHITNDWRDVITHKINIPAAIFTGEYSNNLPSQQWVHASIPNSTLYVYTKEEFGDHFLMAKNPVKFIKDVHEFLQK